MNAGDLHEALIGDEMAGRGGFAAKADEQVAADVGMAGDAAHNAVEGLVELAPELHAAAVAVGEGEHAVDAGVVAESVGGEVGGNAAGDGGRAVDAADDGDVVACAGA